MDNKAWLANSGGLVGYINGLRLLFVGHRICSVVRTICTNVHGKRNAGQMSSAAILLV